jgi:hypothetical protein
MTGYHNNSDNNYDGVNNYPLCNNADWWQDTLGLPNLKYLYYYDKTMEFSYHNLYFFWNQGYIGM